VSRTSLGEIFDQLWSGAAGDQVTRLDLAENLVRTSHDHRIQDPRIGEQNLLDLSGMDQLAAPVDHVVGPPTWKRFPA